MKVVAPNDLSGSSLINVITGAALDCTSMGGFINPYTVPSAAFWKLGQSRPGDIYRFKAVSVDEAQALRRTLDALCGESSLA